MTVCFKNKVVQTNIAASVTSHSCQVLGLSTPWHLSNPSYHKLSPPASRQLISPDTSHGPDRESLYPENNPALLPLLPKSVPVPPLLLPVFLIFLFTLPICLLHITFLYGLLFLSCLHLSLSNHIALVFYRAQSSPTLAFFFLLHSSALGISSLCWWESGKKRLWLPIEE